MFDPYRHFVWVISAELHYIPLFYRWGLFLARPTMFTVMAMSLGTYVVKPFFPECHDPPEVPVKIVTILAMRKNYIIIILSFMPNLQFKNILMPIGPKPFS